MKSKGLRFVAGSCVCLGSLAVVAIGVAQAGPDTENCSSYATYSALASAAGVLVDDAPADLLPVRDADAGLPDAQAHISSLSGSQAWAGAPYSEAASGNLGLTPVDPNQVPVFVVSQYPVDPKETKDTPAASLSAVTGAESATAGVVGGAPATSAATTGRVTTNAATSCGSGGVLDAVAHNEADVFNVAGVLRIGSVVSTAEAQRGPTGAPKLDASMQVEGATVLGQQVAITNQGIVAASSTVPLPDDSSLKQALSKAGIEVDYIAGVRNKQQGYVLAPGLEITVTQPLTGVAQGNNVTTYWLGGAMAQVSLSGDTVAPSQPAPTSAPPRTTAQQGGHSRSSTTAALRAVSAPPAATPPTLAAPAARPAAAADGSLFGPWSITRAYAAMAIAALLLMASSIGMKKLAGRLQ